MAIRLFHALPPIFGGKRRLVAQLFRHVPSPSQAPVFVDAFLGGASVALFAKAKGYRVIGNDIAERALLIGRALIANDRTTITREDLCRLFLPAGRHGAPNDDAGDFIERTYCPDVFTRKHARFLDLAAANLARFPEPKRRLMTLLVVKYCFRMRPAGNFGAKSIIHQCEARDWEEVNPNYLRGPFLDRLNAHPRDNALAIARAINRGVFANGKRNEAHRRDVFEFLPPVAGDVAYFDPPYFGTMAYESALKVVDSILAGEETQAERSAFSREGALGALERMLDLARHIPRWVLSYGNAAVSLDELVALVKRFRPVIEAREIAYVHCSGLAGEASKAKNREFLIVARSA